MAGANAPATAARVDLGEIFRRHGPAWLKTHRIPQRHRKVMQAITSCGTPAQGGRRQWCRACGYERYVYFSCRNRHCPKCQTLAKEQRRIEGCVNGQVQFRYRDRQDGDRCKRETLAAEEFITRFLKHVLPTRFTRVRHYGFLATRNKQRAPARIRELLGAPARVAESPQTLDPWLMDILGIDLNRCPCCGDVLLEDRLPPNYGPPSASRTSKSSHATRGPP